MNRRQFCQWVSALPLAFSGCAVIPDFYDKATYGTPKRIAIIASPNMFSINVDSDINMFFRAGANSAVEKRIVPYLEPLCSEFGPLMRKRMSEVLASNGIQSVEIPFRAPKGAMDYSFIHSTINYPDVAERFFIDSKISLCLMKSGKGIVPSVATYSRLLTPESMLLWRKAVSVGASIYDGSYMIGTINQSFENVDSVVESSKRIATLFLDSASPIGEDVANSLIEVVSTDAPVHYIDAITEKAAHEKANSVCSNGYRTIGRGEPIRNSSIDHVMTVVCNQNSAAGLK